ncbi:MAG: alpha/beta hydrolase, partial [Acidobacteriota bacterium]
EYASVEGHRLLLDLHIPEKAGGAPLLVWVHGGAWRAGSKSRMPLNVLVEEGWAIASVDYRLTPVARFPAQIHDIKAALRFLRARGADYGLDAEHIVIAGNSAGGHLAALVGTSNGDQDLEGSVGDYLEESSDVQATVSFYGASNLTTILEQSTPFGLGVRVPALQLLLGAQPEDAPQIARLASPTFHVDASDPPLLLIHGDQDPQMPINQSHELHGLYLKLELPTGLEVIHGAVHGGPAFYDETRLQIIREFLKAHLSMK